MVKHGKIICEQCGSTKIIRDSEFEFDVVQEKSKETGKLIAVPGSNIEYVFSGFTEKMVLGFTKRIKW
jgi:hypothetical protein